MTNSVKSKPFGLGSILHDRQGQVRWSRENDIAGEPLSTMAFEFVEKLRAGQPKLVRIITGNIYGTARCLCGTLSGCAVG